MGKGRAVIANALAAEGLGSGLTLDADDNVTFDTGSIDWSAMTAAVVDVSADEFAGIIEQADGLAGPAAAKSLARDAASVIDSGYDPWEILADARNVSQSRNTAGYYVSAFTRLVVSSNEIHIEIEERALPLSPMPFIMDIYKMIGENFKKSGVVYIGGGVPKDFIQISAVSSSLLYKDNKKQNAPSHHRKS